MVKKDSLSNDIDLIKEFEELKLKQKLLISSLNRKNKDVLEVQIIDLSKKVDFLVKIFKEANSEDEDGENKLLTLEDIDSKISNFEANLNERFDSMEKRFAEMKSQTGNSQIKKSPGGLPIPDFKAGEVKDKKEETVIEKNISKKEKKKWF